MSTKGLIMKLLDAIELLDCDQVIKDNLLDCISKGLEKGWPEDEFSNYVFFENDILDTGIVENQCELWDEIRELQHGIVNAYQ